MFDQLRGGVFSTNVQRDTAPADTGREGFKVVFGRWHVQQDDVGAVPGQGFRDGCANAAGRAGDQRLAPGQWSRPVTDRRCAGRQAQHLATDKRAFGRQEKPQRPFQLIFGALVDVQQLQGAAVAQFFGQRTAEPFKRPLGTGGKRIALTFRRAAKDHQMRARLQATQQRLEKFAQLFELVGVQHIAGIKHHGLEGGALAWNPRAGGQGLGAIAEHGVGEFIGKSLDVSDQRAAAHQQRAFYRAQTSGLPAFQSHR